MFICAVQGLHPAPCRRTTLGCAPGCQALHPVWPLLWASQFSLLAGVCACLLVGCSECQSIVRQGATINMAACAPVFGKM